MYFRVCLLELLLCPAEVYKTTTLDNFIDKLSGTDFIPLSNLSLISDKSFHSLFQEDLCAFPLASAVLCKLDLILKSLISWPWYFLKYNLYIIPLKRRGV